MGCMDPSADNYNPDATIDDGSCTYANWTPTNGPEGGMVFCTAANGSTIFAGTQIGIFRTTDFGETWIPVNDGLEELPESVNSIVIHGSTIFAATEYGIYRSTTNGAVWVPLYGGYAQTIVFSGSTIYAGVDSDEFLKSTDNGDTWTPVGNGFPEYRFAFAVAVDGPNIYAAVDWFPNFYFSTDNGNSWTPVVIPADIYSITISESKVYLGTEFGVFVSTDHGGNWIAKDNGLAGMDIYSMASSGDSIFAGTFGNGVFVSDDQGDSWTPFVDGLTNLNVISLSVNGNHIFAGTDDRVFKRTL